MLGAEAYKSLLRAGGVDQPAWRPFGWRLHGAAVDAPTRQRCAGWIRGAMIHTTVDSIDRPPAALIEALRSAAPYPVECAGARADDPGRGLGPSIKPLRRWAQISRWAQIMSAEMTVTLDEPDHLIPMYAIEAAHPGDVLVIDVAGRIERAVRVGR